MNPVEIRESLLEKGSIKIDSLLQGIRKGRHFDVLLLAVMDVCRQKKDFRLQKVVLEALAKEHFPKLGALSAYEFAVKLLDMIKKRHSSSTTVLLLQQLVFSAQLMSASKLRSFIKLDLVELHTQLFAEDCETSALLSTIVFYALLMEVSYSPSKLDESQLGEVKAVWDKVLSVNNSEDSAILQLSSFMLYTTLGEDAARFAKNISRRDLFKDVQKRSSMSCVDEWRINTAYDYLLLSFLMTNLSTVALTFPKKKLSQLLDFMICTCSKYQLIKALASEIPQLIDLRYSGRIDRFEQMFFNALESHPEVDVQLFMGPTTLFESRRNKPLDDIPLEPPRKKKKKHDAYELSTWEDFLSATNGTPDELGKLLLKTSSAQLNLLVADLVACSEFSNGELHGLINDHIPEFLHLLNFFLCNRKGFTIEFHTKIAELMTAEEGLKKNSLRLAASLLGCCRCEQVPMLISLCISFLVPIATKHVQEWDSTPSSSSLVGVHDFVLAKLEFLTAIFKHFPKVAQAQAYLLASILPDFFLQLSIYKKESLHFEAEQLEQKLSTIGREIKKQKASFHKFIPFVLSRSLTGEREINFPTYWLLSACDDHDLAVLATNFPPQEKKKYANVQQQFYAMNKIIG